MRPSLFRSRYPVLRAVLLAGAMCCVAAASSARSEEEAAAADPVVDPDTALLFEARIGRMRIGNGIRAFETEAGLCLDFGDVAHALQLAVKLEDGKSRARGWAFSEDHRIDIDRAAGRVEFGSHYEEIAPGSFWRSRSGWCVRADDLARWIGVRLEPDLTNAVLAVESDKELPIEQAAKRAIAADRLRDITAGAREEEPLEKRVLPYRAWRIPSVDLSVRLGTSREPRAGRKHTASYELFAAGELAYFSAQARLASDRNAVPRSLRMRFFREDAGAGLLGPLHATYVGFGDVESLASPLVAQAMPGRGIALVNRPLGLSSSSDTTELVGDLPRGWDAELYRNGELIAATGGRAGRYEFRDIELQYGTNLLEVVRYGPQGQVRREKRLYNIAAQSPGAGEVWYAIGALQDRRDLIDWQRDARSAGAWRATGQVEVGLGKGAALGLGLFHVPRRGGARRYAELTARAGVFGLLNEVNLAAGSGGGTSLRLRSIGQVARSSLSFEAIVNRRLESERISDNLRSRYRLSVSPRIRLAGQIVPLTFDLARVATERDTQERARVRGAITGRSFALGIAAGWQRTHRPLGETVQGGTIDMLFNARLRGIRLRGEANWEIGPAMRFVGAQANGVFAVGASGSGQASLGYGARDRRVRFGLGYTRSFAPVAITASANADTGGAFSLGLDLTLSVGPNGRGRFGSIRAESRAQTGRLLVRAFEDHNGDGIRQHGEDWHPLRTALVNGLPVELEQASDAGGGMLAALAPAVPVSLAIDPSSIADPNKVPTSRGVMVAPRAGVVMPLELGIVSTGTVEGTLADARGPLAGYRLELVGLDGQGNLVTHSEFDGLFVFEGVRHGRYMLKMIDKSGPVELRMVETGANKARVRLGRIGTAGALAVAASPQSAVPRAATQGGN